MCDLLNLTVVDISNYANKYVVNGEVKKASLSGVVMDPFLLPGEILVGPSFVPRQFWGPYWIVAYGPTVDNYEWFVVSAGPPKAQSASGYCKTNGTNSGLWIFTSATNPPSSLILSIRQVMVGLGYDLSGFSLPPPFANSCTVLNQVYQQSCTYPFISSAVLDN